MSSDSGDDIESNSNKLDSASYENSNPDFDDGEGSSKNISPKQEPFFESSDSELEMKDMEECFIKKEAESDSEGEPMQEWYPHDLLKVSLAMDNINNPFEDGSSDLPSCDMDPEEKARLALRYEELKKEARERSQLKKMSEADPEYMTFDCDECEYKGTKYCYLLDHKRRVHSNIRFPCDKCDYRATTKPTLIRHQMTVHLDEVEMDPAEKALALAKREEKKRLEREKMRMCRLLKRDKTPPIKIDLGDAVGVEEFVCEQCGYTGSRRNLRHHVMSVHLDIKYPCDKCDHRSTTKESLKTHKLTHLYEDDEMDPEQKQILIEKYERKKQITRDRMREKRRLNGCVPRARVEHPCDKCDHKATTKQSLKIHKLRHLDEYDDMDPDEKEVLKAKYEILKKKHRERVQNRRSINPSSGNKPEKIFQCQKCEFQSTSYADLRSHKKEFHPVIKETTKQNVKISKVESKPSSPEVVKIDEVKNAQDESTPKATSQKLYDSRWEVFKEHCSKIKPKPMEPINAPPSIIDDFLKKLAEEKNVGKAVLSSYKSAIVKTQSDLKSKQIQSGVKTEVSGNDKKSDVSSPKTNEPVKQIVKVQETPKVQQTRSSVSVTPVTPARQSKTIPSNKNDKTSSKQSPSVVKSTTAPQAPKSSDTPVNSSKVTATRSSTPKTGVSAKIYSSPSVQGIQQTSANKTTVKSTALESKPLVSTPQVNHLTVRGLSHALWTCLCLLNQRFFFVVFGLRF